MLSSRFVLLIAVALILIGAAEYVRPFGPPMLSRMPVLVILLGALLAARYFAHAAARKRSQMINEVPRNPLGISDDD